MTNMGSSKQTVAGSSPAGGADKFLSWSAVPVSEISIPCHKRATNETERGGLDGTEQEGTANFRQHPAAALRWLPKAPSQPRRAYVCAGHIRDQGHPRTAPAR